MLLLGHRGCRGALMENTIAAFDHAMESGCDGFELDVRRAACGTLMVWHDARLRGKFISRQSFSTLRERCRIAGKLPRREPVELCELEAVLARYSQVAWIDIELKVRGIETQVVELLRRCPPVRGFVLSSFRKPVLMDVHRIAPELPLGYIFDRMPKVKIWRELPVQYLKPSAKLITPARVRQFHAAGMKVLTWTVNHPTAMRRLSEAGVDGMIGDDPALLAENRFQGFQVSGSQA